MQINIFGSSGFIGSKLHARYIKENRVVRAFDLNSPSSFDLNDDSTWPQLGSRDIVYLLSSVSSHGMFDSDKALGYKTNITSTLAFLEYLFRSGVQKIIFTSSEWVFGDQQETLVTESDTPTFAGLSSGYAVSKLVIETCLKGMACELGQEKPSILVARLGIVVGSQRSSGASALEAIVRDLKKGGLLTVGSLKTARRFIYVDDVVENLYGLSARETGTYNLTGDTLISLGDIVSEAAEQLGVSVAISEADAKGYTIRNVDSLHRKSILQRYDLIKMINAQF